MSKKLSSYPMLMKSADLMIRDNVGNPHMLKSLLDSLKSYDFEDAFTVETLVKVENELALMDNETFEEFCIGECDLVEASIESNDVLAYLFDSLF